MKKAKRLKRLAITTTVFLVIFLFLMVICIIRPDFGEFGEYITNLYCDITNETYSPEELLVTFYDALLVPFIVTCAILFVFNQVFLYAYIIQSKKIKYHEIKKAVREQRRIDREKRKNKKKAIKQERRKLKEERNTMKKTSKKKLSRKEKKQLAQAAKKVGSAVEEVKEVVAPAQGRNQINQHELNDFMNMLKK